MNLSDIDTLSDDNTLAVNPILRTKFARILAFREDKRSTPIDVMADEKQKCIWDQNVIISTARTALNDYQLPWSSLRYFDFDFWNIDEGKQLGKTDDIALAAHVLTEGSATHLVISGDNNQSVGGADSENSAQQATMRKLSSGDGTLRCKNIRFCKPSAWAAETVQIL